MVAREHPLKNVTTKEFAGAVVAAIMKMDLSDSVEPAKEYIPVGEVDVGGQREGRLSGVSNLTDDFGNMSLHSVLMEQLLPCLVERLQFSMFAQESKVYCNQSECKTTREL